MLRLQHTWQALSPRPWRRTTARMPASAGAGAAGKILEAGTGKADPALPDRRADSGGAAHMVLEFPTPQAAGPEPGPDVPPCHADLDRLAVPRREECGRRKLPVDDGGTIEHQHQLDRLQRHIEIVRVGYLEGNADRIGAGV